MAGMIYVQLDADYDSDDRLLEAGPLAELLYVRGLAFAKRTLSDGHITRAQLAIVGRAIPTVRKHAQRLVDTGAWKETATGYEISAWKKRNKSAAEVAATGAQRQAAAIRANHDRWHTQGRRSSTCPLCPSDIGSGSGSVTGSVAESTETETESETETETTVGSSHMLNNATATPATTTFADPRGLVRAVIGYYADSVSLGADNPRAYRQTVIANTTTEFGPALAAYVHDHPTATVAEVAAAVLCAHSAPTTSRAPVGPTWHSNPSCAICGGDGLVSVADADRPTFGPCPCRQPIPYPTPLATVHNITDRTATL